MTRENAKKLLPIITAYAAGKTIEYYSQTGDTFSWIDISGEGFTADFSSEAERYRIKPTKKWVDEVGAPGCPIHGEMTVEKKDEESPEDGDGE